MSTIHIKMKADLKDVAQTIAMQYGRGSEAIEFLRDLDGFMASWDFTSEAAELFVSSCLDEKRAQDRSVPTARASLARVKEFMRQAQLQNHVEAGHPIMSVWTDPNSEGAPLGMDDLAVVLELAATALTREEK